MEAQIMTKRYDKTDKDYSMIYSIDIHYKIMKVI
jgi:hypothetical protein